MERTRRMKRKKRGEMTTSLSSFSCACLRCMKKSATMRALMVAMVRATTALKRPRSMKATLYVMKVPSSSEPQTARYVFNGEDFECSDIRSLGITNLRVPVDQVEQREQIDPDNIDEVPVQSPDVEGRVIFGREATLPRHEQEPCKNTQSDDHVERVQAGHDEVQREENLGVARVGVLVRMSWNGHVIEAEGCARYVVLVEFLFVFDALDAEESETEKHGQDKAANHQGATADLRAPYGEHHGQAAADEDRRVRGTKAGLNR